MRELKYNPTSFDFLKNDLKKLEYFFYDYTESLEGILRETVKNTLTISGKRIRPSLFLICARNENYNIDYLLPAAAAIEIIHTASLIHDDIIDKSILRRGKRTIHYTYDNDTAKFVGDYLFTHTFSLLNSYKIPRILEEMSYAAQFLVIGEFNQLKTKRNLKQSEEVYLEKINEKTSSLFRLSCVLGGILSGSDEKNIENMKKFGEYIGISFQINDDLIDVDINGSSINVGKPIGNDFKQGDITLPFIYGLRDPVFKKALKPLLNKSSFSQEELKKMLNLLSNTDAIKTTRDKFNFYLLKAREIISLIDGEERKKGLEKVCDYIMQATNLL